MKNIIISGANGDIGFDITKQLSNKEYKLTLISGTNEKTYSKLKEFAENHNSIKCIVKADISNPLDVKNAFSGISENQDAAICCIGKSLERKPISEWDYDYIQNGLKSNLIAPLLFCSNVIPFLNPNAVIVILGSIAGEIGSGSGSGLYSSAKAALHNIVKTLSKEMSDKSIRVIGISPGLIETDFHNNDLEKTIETAKKITLSKRIGTSNDISKLVEFLISENSSYINGTVIRIDGGILL